MAPRLRRVDKLTLPDHPHLTEEDECYFYGEYTAYRGWRYSDTNNLIYNLKKGVDRRDRPEWRYKEEAILKAANALRSAINPRFLTSAALVPIPPSRARSDPGAPTSFEGAAAAPHR